MRLKFSWTTCKAKALHVNEAKVPLMDMAVAMTTSELVGTCMTDRSNPWEEFSNDGMLWWVNRILHTFGWEIALQYDENFKYMEAYPRRTENLGFTSAINEKRLKQFRERNEH